MFFDTRNSLEWVFYSKINRNTFLGHAHAQIWVKLTKMYSSYLYHDGCLFLHLLTPEIHWNGLFYSKINRNTFLGNAHAQIWVKSTNMYSSYLYHAGCLFLHFLTPEIHWNGLFYSKINRNTFWATPMSKNGKIRCTSPSVFIVMGVYSYVIWY